MIEQNNTDNDNYTVTIKMNDYLYYDNILPLHGGVKERNNTIGKGKFMKTLQDYKDFLAVEHRKEYTQHYYYDTIRKLLIDINKNLDDITKQDIDNWIAQKNKQQLRHNTINNYIIRINLFLKWLNKPEWKVKRIGWRQTNRHILSLEQLIQLRETAKKTSPEHYLIMTLITDTDARPCEICDLKWNNIIDNKIYFDDSKTGDNYGFLTQDLLEALYAYKLVRPVSLPNYEDFVFIGHKGQFKGKRYSRKATRIRKVINDIIAQTDINHNITPYDIRASVGTQEFNQCINPKIIQRKFRHHNLRTTMTYNHIDDKTVEEYANSGLIWNNKSLLPVESKKQDINDRLYISYPPQDSEFDGNKLSFSFFFSFELYESSIKTFRNGISDITSDNCIRVQLEVTDTVGITSLDTQVILEHIVRTPDIPFYSLFFDGEGIPSQSMSLVNQFLPTTHFGGIL